MNKHHNINQPLIEPANQEQEKTKPFFDKKSKTIGSIAAIAIFLSFTFGGFQYLDKKELRNGLDAEMIKTEFLTSEKMMLSKQISGLKTEINALTGRNAELDKLLAASLRNLEAKEQEIVKLEKQHKLNERNYKTQLESVHKIKRDLINQVEALKNENSQFSHEIAGLKNTLTNLQKENQLLNDKLNDKPATASNFLIEVVKGRKDKLTVKARRTDKIKVNFDFTDKAYQQNALNQFQVEVISPKGTKVNGKVESQITKGEREVTASLKEVIHPSATTDKVTINFEPNDKLTPGVYSILVFKGNTYLGNTQFKVIK
jgi:uncharacterized protein (DUF3084 family)